MKPLFEAINNIFVDEIEENKEHIILKNKKTKNVFFKNSYFHDSSDSVFQKRKKIIEEKNLNHHIYKNNIKKDETTNYKKDTQIKKNTKKLNDKTSLFAKSEIFDVPIWILKEVYQRGVETWKTQSKRRIKPQQLGHERVNSFLSKGKTYYTTESDLAEEWKKYKKKERKLYS